MLALLIIGLLVIYCMICHLIVHWSCVFWRHRHHTMINKRFTYLTMTFNAAILYYVGIHLPLDLTYACLNTYHYYEQQSNYTYNLLLSIYWFSLVTVVVACVFLKGWHIFYGLNYGASITTWQWIQLIGLPSKHQTDVNIEHVYIAYHYEVGTTSTFSTNTTTTTTTTTTNGKKKRSNRSTLNAI